MGFSGDGQRLVVVAGDNRHSVFVYHWSSKTLIFNSSGHNGQPPQVYGVVWNPFTIDTDSSGVRVVAPTMFVTYGVKHLKIWTLAKDEVSVLLYVWPSASQLKLLLCTQSVLLSRCAEDRERGLQ